MAATRNAAWLFGAVLLAAALSAAADAEYEHSLGRRLHAPLVCKTNPGQYKSSNKCVDCKAGVATALTPAGAQKETDCYCTPTGVNYYKPTVGCTPCDTAGSTTGTSPDGKTCTCAATFRYFNASSGACLASCLPGFYSKKPGNCTACAGTGALTPDWAENQGQCFCPLGGDSYYKENVGCTLCSDPSTLPTSTDGKRCDCADGYANFNRTTGTCSVVCSVGFYKLAGVCTQCVGDAAAPGVTLFTNITSEDNTSEKACYCTPGGTDYYKLGAGCTACDTATTNGTSPNGRKCSCLAGFKDFNGTTNACSRISCGSGKYFDGTVCKSCESATTTGTAAADGLSCNCKPGFAGFDPVTAACSSRCPSGQFWAAATSECKPCNSAASLDPLAGPFTAPGSTSEDACFCNATILYPATQRLYYQSASGCVLCGTGTTGKSTDGKTCSCSFTPASLVEFNKVSNSCCTKLGQKCGAANQPTCCGGKTCTGTGTNKKCA